MTVEITIQELTTSERRLILEMIDSWSGASPVVQKILDGLKEKIKIRGEARKQ